MPNIMRARVEWSGSAITGAGVSTFYFAESTTGVTAALTDWANAINSEIPAGTQLDIPNTGDVLDAETGALVDVWVDGTVGGAGGGGGPDHPQGVGARVRWITSGFAMGRRVVGSTFIVPLSGNTYDADGTLKIGTLVALQGGCDGLLSDVGNAMRIWTRPVGGAGGGVSTVVAAQVVDRVSWLKSRRS